MAYIPKFLLNIIDSYNINNVIDWLKEMIIFIIKPTRFINGFFAKTKELQIHQVIFYMLINVLIYFVYGFDDSQKAFYRHILLIFLTALPFILINVISFLILSKSVNIWKVISFPIICNLIFFIPIFFFIHFFFSTENYLFNLLSNLVVSIIIVYNMFIIWNTFSQSIIKIVLGYSLNVFALNMLFLVAGFISKDSYSSQKIFHSILEEYNYYGEYITDISGKPYNYIMLKDPKSKNQDHYLGYINNDTVSYYNMKYVKDIRQRAVQNSKKIDSIIPLLFFKRNKDIYTSLSNHFKSFNKYLENPYKDVEYINQRTYKDDNTKKVILIKQEFLIQEENLKYLNEYESKLNELIKAEEYASSPNILQEILLYPLNYSLEHFGGVSEKQVTFFIH